MALGRICDKGHEYVQFDKCLGYPKGAPHCPICYEEWNFDILNNMKNTSKEMSLQYGLDYDKCYNALYDLIFNS